MIYIENIILYTIYTISKQIVQTYLINCDRVHVCVAFIVSH